MLWFKTFKGISRVNFARAYKFRNLGFLKMQVTHYQSYKKNKIKQKN